MSSFKNISTSGSGNNVKYVYDLPYFDRKELCRIFDENNQWEVLGGGFMNYSSSELSEFGRSVYRGESPTNALLTAWGSQNHTVLELYVLFRRMSHFRGMKTICKFVDSKYHVYMRDSDVNATVALIQLDTELNIGAGAEAKVQNVAATEPKLDKDMKDNINKNPVNLGTLAESTRLLPQIPYEELMHATDSWNRSNILGRGGFGTVYKGVWKNTAVAIKRMEQRANHAYVESQLKQSEVELRLLNTYRHDNILPLYGFSLSGEHPCLVYQYMNNGSLEDRILCRQKSSPLNWSIRYQICKGVACGIQFLHSIGTKPLIHGDIKCANILLDRNFEPKVGDFGLAREMNSSPGASYVKVSRVHGTRPYLPDEYLRSKKLSTKVDTFSFGIVLYEVTTGQRAYEDSRPKKFLKDIVEEAESTNTLEVIKDSKGGTENSDLFWILIRLGKSCTARIAKERPEMVHVLKSLEGSISHASSFRTISSHVTGLPLLFETKPASLLMPIASSTTHRLSPVEMRAGSPFWHQAQQAKYSSPMQLDSSRRSPLPSAPSPQNVLPSGSFNPLSNNIVPPSEVSTTATTCSNTSNSNNIHSSIPIQNPSSHQGNNVNIPTGQGTLGTSPTSNINPNVPVTINLIDGSMDPLSVSPLLPRSAIADAPIPVFLETEEGTTENLDGDGFDTVIPLITELGVKD